jgi:hypothetical protein
MRMPIFAGLSAAICCSLMGCGEGGGGETSQPRDKAALAIRANIDELLRPGRSNADYIQTLRSQIKLSEGILLITAPMSPTLWVLPANSPWVLECGPLLSLVFGGAVTGSPESVSSTVDVTLSLAILSEDRCRELAPLLGREINQILSGN